MEIRARSSREGARRKISAKRSSGSDDTGNDSIEIDGLTKLSEGRQPIRKTPRKRWGIPKIRY
jgi:hypothetical protein